MGHSYCSGEFSPVGPAHQWTAAIVVGPVHLAGMDSRWKVAVEPPERLPGLAQGFRTASANIPQRVIAEKEKLAALPSSLPPDV
jgi:hypothetical protein